MAQGLGLGNSVAQKISQSKLPYKNLSLGDIWVGTFFIDYGVTVVIGLINRKPQFIIYGLFFFIMHFIVSLVLLSSIIPGFFGSSAGRWEPPTRSKEQLG